MTVIVESATDDSTSESIGRRWPRWLRFPSFTYSCATTLLVCVAYLCWIIIDAQYSVTLFAVCYSVGLQQVDGPFWDMIWDSVRSWDSLGPRLLLFAILALIAATSSVLMLLQFVRRTTIRRMLLVVLAISAWLSLLVSYNQINEWATLRRATAALSRFETVANSLSQKWPTESGTLPEAGAYFAYPDNHPNLLMLHGRRGYPVREDFGYQIELSEEGAIRFNLSGATDCQIEYHPQGSYPNSYSSNLSGTTMTMAEAIPLKEHWFLVHHPVLIWG